MQVKPINFLELRAVIKNQRSFALFLKEGTNVKICKYNQAVVSIFNKIT